MITVRHKISHTDLPHLNIEPDSVIFDIETTGFAAKHCVIYMIGLLFIEDGQFILEQWFREKDSDEYEILHKFNQMLLDRPKLYSFNGDQFDLSFITKRMALYRMSLLPYESIDFLKRLRPYKKTLGLENLKLKTVEAYFDYEREDPFTGGDLIEIYKRYLTVHEEPLFKTLLLHNYEDLLGLGRLISHKNSLDLLDDFRNGLVDVDLYESTIENNVYKGTFILKEEYNLHKSYQMNNAYGKVSFKKFTDPSEESPIHTNICSLEIDTSVDTLRVFLEPTKDYYYLPNEDYAIHKSIGKFVHPDHRIKATKENCYIKKEDFFLPGSRQFELPIHQYYATSKDKTCFFSVEELIESNTFNHYIKGILKYGF